MIDKIGRAFAILVLISISYAAGRQDGAAISEAKINAAEAARLSEYNRVMQFVGVCKWAKIMASNVRCQGELP